MRPKFTDERRKGDASSLKEAFNDLLDTYKIKRKFNEKQVVAYWSKLMGAPIANRTSKIFVKDKILFVELTSAPLKQELNMSKSKVLQLIEKEFGPDVIAEVIFL